MFEDLKPWPSAPLPAPAAPPAPAEAGPVQPASPESGTGIDPEEPSATWLSPPTDPADAELPEETSEDPPEEDRGSPEWKEALREDFEQWLEDLDELPEPEEEGSRDEESPDLYSFYEQLAAANTETRKSNRRVAEAISQWSETVGRFDSSLAPLRETITQLTAAQPKGGEMSRPHCLALVELLDRLQRVGQAFGTSAPKSSWWRSNDAAWRQAWETQRQALDITLSHLQGLLAKEGVTRIEALGQTFDPSVMTAVAVETNPSRPNQAVLKELAAGYRRNGELLRAAQVKVNRQSTPSPS
jgi:molecular chaperone GrpE (heat shock protein)